MMAKAGKRSTSRSNSSRQTQSSSHHCGHRVVVVVVGFHLSSFFGYIWDLIGPMPRFRTRTTCVTVQDLPPLVRMPSAFSFLANAVQARAFRAQAGYALRHRPSGLSASAYGSSNGKKKDPWLK